ncbi:MAG: carbohydrate ABC transporter permease [Abitibacteriaceae bacterium]|nr:carbohydrate ABC transporter permease [Abditibacteriaceae bacterium]MBV9867346.1 carbohydrate ABC transporter permease [Abditibacteriaceae bacterium]
MRNQADFWKQGLVYGSLVALSIIFLLPFLWLVSTSFKTDKQILVYPPVWIPHPFQWKNYANGLTAVPFGLYLRNTLLICAANVVGTVLSSSLVAYGLSRIPWRGREVLFYLFIGTMLLPPQVTMVPVFTIFKNLGWLDTYLPLTFPSFLASAFNVFLLRQFFRTIPNELTEAARIDGASEWDNYRLIVLPLAKPALWTIGLFAFIGAWNDYLGPLIYLFDDRKYTLSLGLAMFKTQYSAEWGQMMAVSTVVTLPLIILFFFTQRTFVRGITMTGLKG